MTTKLRIKVGAVEVECEGSDDFLRTELPALLKAVLDLRASAGDATKNEEETSEGSNRGKGGSTATKVSTSTVAAKMGAKSGSDLALAAAAALIIGEGKESASRSEILKSMQSAKAYYKATYRSNLSNSLATLVKSQSLLDHGGDNFGLHNNKRKEIEATLNR